MCLKPRKINNPTRHISANGGQPLRFECSCGQCAECKKAKRLEWRFRAHYEVQACLNKGGYIYFDTLTYSEEYVPRLSHFVNLTDSKISDFTCFNHQHWRLFLKNLRRQLAYHHKSVTFKYFLTSEYGTREDCTHRPHYHILFFIYGPIHPFDFSKLVSKCWDFGRTDGLPFQTNVYVAQHVYGFELGYEKTKDSINATKACNYVSKYVTKDSTFQKEINKRVSRLQKFLKDDEEFLKVRRSIDMFHRQSQGFGVDYVNSMSSDEYYFLCKNAACRVKDSDKVVLVIPLPQYYKRKLFYNCLKDEDNKYFWQLNNTGRLWQKEHLLASINSVLQRYSTLYLNAPMSDRMLVDKLLADRSLEDFVIYKLFYKGRCRNLIDSFSRKRFAPASDLSDTEYNLNDWLDTIIDSSFARTNEFNVLSRDDESNTVALPSSYGNIFGEVKTTDVSYNNFINLTTFNENSCSHFRNFDKLDAHFVGIKTPDDKNKQATFDFVEDLTKRFNILYYGSKNI